jgi:GNAT superfamily N-acetyltransferase
MNVIEFAPGGKNRTPEVVDALMRAEPGTVLRFSKGVYDFYADGAYQDIFFPACNRSGDKKVIFPLIRLEDIVIDGGGANFLFHDRVTPFVAQMSKKIRFQDFTMDFSFPRCCVCRVISSTEEGLLLDMRDSHCDVGVNSAGNLTIQAGRDLFSSCEKRFFLKQGLNMCFIVAGEYFFDTTDRPAPFFFCRAEKTEDGIFLRAYPGSFVPHFNRDELMISYDELRENDMFFIDRCDDTTFEYVRIYHGAGMGCVGQLNHNMTFHKFDIKPPEGSGEIYSTTADGILLSNCTGRIDIHECTIHKPMDDVMSVHGIYTVVDKIIAPNKAIVGLMHRSHAGYNPFVSGDELTVSEQGTLRETGTVRVMEAFFRDDLYKLFVRFDGDIRDRLHPGDYLENAMRTPEVSVTDCDFEDFPSIRFGTSRPVYFARNHLKNFHAILLNDLTRYWYSTGQTRHVNIEGNTFENSDSPIQTILERPAGSGARHSFLTVKGNKFINCRCLLRVTDVNNLTFTDNIFESGCVELDRVSNGVLQNIEGNEKASVGQLLMKWFPAPVDIPMCPDGYTMWQYRRGGDEFISEDEFRNGWLNCVFQAKPRDKGAFDWLNGNQLIPDDGFFVVMNADCEIVSTASVLLNEHESDSATLHMVYTHVNHRGKGLANIVTLAAMDYIYKKDVRVAYLTTDEFRDSAIRLYIKNGFLPEICSTEMAERWNKLKKG